MYRAFFQWLARGARSAPMLALGAAAALGVGLSQGLSLTWWHWAPALLVAVLTAGMARGPWLRGTAAVLAVISGFAMAHSTRMPLPGDLDAAAVPQVVRFSGWICAEPKVHPYRTTALVKITDWESALGVVPSAGERLLVVWVGAPPAYGQRVRVRGTLSRIAPPANPGLWDRAAWHAQRGVYFQVTSLYARDCEAPADLPRRGNPLIALGLTTRDAMAARLREGLRDTPVTVGILQGLVLGVTDSSEPQLFDLFRETGTLHLFAVSGLHVGMIAVFFNTLFQMLGLGRRSAAALLIPVLMAYAMITGLQVPVVRSTLIAVIFCASVLIFRRPSLLNSTGAAAFLLLLWDTRQLLQVGFQFSFCVVLAIILLGDMVSPMLRRIGAPDAYLPRSLWSRRQVLWLACCQAGVGLVVAGVASWLGSMPLTLGYSRLVSWISLPANLVVIPLSFVVVVCGLLAIFLGWLPWVGGAVAAAFNNVAWLFIQGMMLFLNLCWQTPGAFQYHDLPPRLPAPAFSATVMSIPRGGGATLLSVPGEDWLIDTGGDVPFVVMAEPALRREGVVNLRGLILTHQDSGHIGGFVEAVEFLRPAEVFGPANLQLPVNPEIASGPPPEPRVLARGDRLPLGRDGRLEVLWPPRGLTGGQADNRCLVLRAVTPGGTVLFMNDAGFAAETALLRDRMGSPGEKLRADVLVMHGHASDVYGSPAFLRAVQPRVIILAGEYGNDPLFARRLGVLPGAPQVWRTAKSGAIRVICTVEGDLVAGSAR